MPKMGLTMTNPIQNLDSRATEPAATDATCRPLEGIRVADFSAFMAGPTCARWLADLGAEVIKVEPVGGEHMRVEPPLVDGHSRYFGHMNAGKRSVAMNLKDTETVALARELCLKSDVIIENFRPGVMTRLGLGAETLRASKPELVYCSISGFGQHSSISSMPAYAAIVQAASGFDMANLRYQDESERPANQGIHIADMLTSVFAGFSIQTALLHRERTGQGSTIDVSLMDSMMNLLVFETQNAQFPQANRPRLAKPLRTKDSFVLVSPTNDNNFQAICRCTGHEEWLQDPALSTFEARYRNWDEFQRRIETWTRQHSAEDCERVLMAAGVPCSRYRTVEDTMSDPQFVERESYSTVTDEGGSFKVPNLPFMVDRCKPKAGLRVPRTGEDTRSVLEEMLDLRPEQIERLAAEGKIVL